MDGGAILEMEHRQACSEPLLNWQEGGRGGLRPVYLQFEDDVGRQEWADPVIRGLTLAWSGSYSDQWF